MVAIDLALDDLNSQSVPNISHTAKKFGVDRTTLSRRWRGITRSMDTAYKRREFLNESQSKFLIKYINRVSAQGLAPTPLMVRTWAAEIAKKEPSAKWPSRWIKRNSKCLKSGYLSGLDKSRKNSESAFYYALYFELLARKIEQYRVKIPNIWNMDEKGFLMGILQKQRRYFSKAYYETGALKHVLQDGSRSWITCLAAICADGRHLDPMLIYEAVSGDIQDTWIQDYNENIHKCSFASSPTGWTNNELGYQWLTRVFEPYTRPTSDREWRVLILDGHGSHVTMKFIDFALSHRILLAVFPPHSTHRLQPLDVSLFAPLAQYYSQELDIFIHDSEGLCSVTKRDFFRLFWPSFQKAFAEKNVLSGFRKTGLSPFNPTIILGELDFKIPSEDSRLGSEDSVSSEVSLTDWRKIERLLKVTYRDFSDKETQRLDDIILQITSEISVLRGRVDGLRRALQNEIKKRKRQKPAFKTTGLKEEGYAQLLAKQDTEKERQQAQKYQAILKRQQKNQEKKVLLAARQKAREESKKQRETEVLVKAQQQLIGDIRQSRLRNKKEVVVLSPLKVQDSGEGSSRPKRTRKAPARFLDFET
ncbi:putative pogo transposable element [Patellaria atrata CBS 101060]|uniref:Pogo transposable element n=1 Tax=Patellaria atrata CBS 101060 TaxID=1346257 RepID=A0A9P4S5K8_9PEZI|nr:putative pogo transposable element [Patellaria atrata CBS 101060]